MPPFSSRPLLARRLERLLERVDGLGSSVSGASAPDHAPTTILAAPPQVEALSDATSDVRWVTGPSKGPPNYPVAEPLGGSFLEGRDASPLPPQVHGSAEAVVERDGLLRRIGRLFGLK